MKYEDIPQILDGLTTVARQIYAAMTKEGVMVWTTKDSDEFSLQSKFTVTKLPFEVLVILIEAGLVHEYTKHDEGHRTIWRAIDSNDVKEAGDILEADPLPLKVTNTYVDFTYNGEGILRVQAVGMGNLRYLNFVEGPEGSPLDLYDRGEA